ncbi:hypothetical protein DAPPUDRAFT_35494, partial [Daphnia pulex]
MGLGKTLSMISLIACQKENQPILPSESDINDPNGGTLIICPSGVLGQWEQEIRKHSVSLSVAVYYGAVKKRKEMHLTLHTYDIVLTSYGIRIILTKYISPVNVKNDKTQSILVRITFFRVILDEAHVIRNPSTKVSNAVSKLQTSHRWAVTGTPVQNRELFLYPIIRFLRVLPFNKQAV